ncbi:unnamed protein product [Rotaria magnacalcarata]
MEIHEFLAPPRLLICSECNDPGHMKRNCSFHYNACRRCGNDRSIGEHKECTICCHRCKQSHISTDYKCPYLINYRKSILYRLKEKPDILPHNIQLFVPTEYRTQGKKYNKLLTNPASKLSNFIINTNTNNPQSFNMLSCAWPSLMHDPKNNVSPINEKSIWNDLKQNQNEINKLNDIINIKMKAFQTKYDDHIMKINSALLTMSQQMKSQNDNLVRCCSSINELVSILSPTVEVLQLITKNSMLNNNKIHKSETQELINKISQSLELIKDRNNLISSNQNELLQLIEHQNELMNHGIKCQISSSAIYVPPQSIPPFQLLSKHLNKRFYIFANYNAKHTDWKCSKNNTSDVHLQNSLESTENELIIPSKATSKRSNAIIHFGITQDASGWISEVLDEGTSEHFPVLIQSSLTIDGTSTFRKANWKTFNFFLWLLNEYWLSVVYNLDEQTFFNLFSAFLSALWDRCSTNEKICDYRPPWPPHLVLLAKSTNRARRKYRRNRSLVSLQNYIILKEIFSTERSNYLHIKMEQKTKYMMHDQNIWKFAKPSFHCVTTPFRGLKYGNEKINDSEKIVEILANHYERHISESDFDMDNIAHTESIINYNHIKYTPNIPLDPISITKVTNEWNKFKAKKVIR